MVPATRTRPVMTAALAASTVVRRGIAARVTRIMPVLYSPLIASTARIATIAWPRSTPVRLILTVSTWQTAPDGHPLDLSDKEFGVLEALLRASPAFLSAEALLEQVWDEQADPFTNTVTVTIGRLRRKLGDPPVISTTPGVGYRITP